MQPLLSVHNVTVTYRSSDRPEIRALEDVTFEVAAGEAVGLLGESGCGKTTLALTLLKSLPQAARVLRGSVIFRGTDLLTLEESGVQKVRGAGISMVHQEPGLALNPVIRVGDQVSEVLRAHQTMTAARAKEEARSLLLQVGFAADSRVWDAYPHQLSGGQQQRVAIAQAIACRPPLVIADEPTTALDVAAQIEILALLKSLKEKLQMAILIITHETWPLTQFVDRVLVMYAGRIVEEGPARRVLEQPLHPYTYGLLHSRPMGPHKRPLVPVPGEPPDPANLPAGCAFSPRCSGVMKVCHTCAPQSFSPETSRQVACFKYAE